MRSPGGVHQVRRAVHRVPHLSYQGRVAQLDPRLTLVDCAALGTLLSALETIIAYTAFKFGSQLS